MDFPERLSVLISERGLNSLKLSKEIGTSDSLIGEWRRGKKRPSLDNLLLLADFFEVSIDFLVGRAEARVSETKKEPAAGMSSDERELLSCFNAMGAEHRAALLTTARAFAASNDTEVMAPPAMSEGKAV